MRAGTTRLSAVSSVPSCGWTHRRCAVTSVIGRVEGRWAQQVHCLYERSAARVRGRSGAEVMGKGTPVSGAGACGHSESPRGQETGVRPGRSRWHLPSARPCSGEERRLWAERSGGFPALSWQEAGRPAHTLFTRVWGTALLTHWAPLPSSQGHRVLFLRPPWPLVQQPRLGS